MAYFEELFKQLPKHRASSPGSVVEGFLTFYQQWQKEFESLQKELKQFSQQSTVEIRDQLLKEAEPFLRKLCEHYTTANFWVAKTHYGWFGFYYDLLNTMPEIGKVMLIDNQRAQVITKKIKNRATAKNFTLVKKHQDWLIDDLKLEGIEK